MLQFLIEHRHIVQYALFFGLTAFAFWRGQAPEKLTGMVFIGAIVLVMLLATQSEPDTGGKLNTGYAMLDLAMTIALAVIALRANRMYPIIILGFQLISLAAHLQRGLLDPISPSAYLILTRIPSWLQLVAFAAGLAAHRRRVRRGILVPPWSRRFGR